MKNIFERNIHCEKCNSNYDEELYECPNCHSENPLGNKRSLSNPFEYMTTLQQILIFFIGFIGLYIFVFFYTAAFSSFAALDSNNNYYLASNFYAWIELLSYLSGAIVLVIISFKYFPLLFKHLKKEWLKVIIAAVITCIALYVFNVILNLISASIFGEITENNNQTQLIEMIKAEPVLSFIFIVILAPILEELTYRAGFFSALRKINKYLAYIATLILFGLIHFDFTAENILVELVNLPSYMFAGFALSFVFDHYGMETSIFAHSLNNLVSFILILVV